MIIVVDSGIWISAFAFGGTPQAALKSISSHHTIAICDEIIREVVSALVRKFAWKEEEVVNLLDAFASEWVHVPTRGELHGVCRDPKDDMVFECAVNSCAQMILTGDRDLLVIQSYKGVKVLTVRQYLDAAL